MACMACIITALVIKKTLECGAGSFMVCSALGLLAAVAARRVCSVAVEVDSMLLVALANYMPHVVIN